MSLTGDGPRVRRLRAMAHPVRLEMLSLLTGAAMSAAEVARELDITQANASYHLRLLSTSGLVEPAGEERVNGGVAKRYRAIWDAQEAKRPDGDLDSANADADAEIRTMLDVASMRLPHRVRQTRGAYTDAALWVPPEVWDEVLDQLRQTSRLLHESARPPRSEGTVRANLSIFAFRLQDSTFGTPTT